jgi:hypothetical protein
MSLGPGRLSSEAGIWVERGTVGQADHDERGRSQGHRQPLTTAARDTGALGALRPGDVVADRNGGEDHLDPQPGQGVHDAGGAQVVRALPHLDRRYGRAAVHPVGVHVHHPLDDHDRRAARADVGHDDGGGRRRGGHGDGRDTQRQKGSAGHRQNGDDARGGPGGHGGIPSGRWNGRPLRLTSESSQGYLPGARPRGRMP